MAAVNVQHVVISEAQMRNKMKWALIAMILSSVVNAAERDFVPSAPAPSRVFGWVE